MSVQRLAISPKRKAQGGERTIVTIHGIRTDGGWQTVFEQVFEPHFHYESFKYSAFKHSFLAVPLLALEWVAILLAFGLILSGWWAGALSTWLAGACAVLALVAAILGAGIVADALRDSVVIDFINFVDTAVEHGRRPHVVAHSLGSFILGRSLRRYEPRRDCRRLQQLRKWSRDAREVEREDEAVFA